MRDRFRKRGCNYQSYPIFSGRMENGRRQVRQQRVIMKHQLTGSVLCPAQPLPLWVALNTDDVHPVSLLQWQLCLTASVVHTSLDLVDRCKGANELAHTQIHTEAQGQTCINTHAEKTHRKYRVTKSRPLNIFLTTWTFYAIIKLCWYVTKLILKIRNDDAHPVFAFH